MDHKDLVQLYRQRAEELRTIAESLAVGRPRHDLQELAQQWDAMADQAEARLPLHRLARALDLDQLKAAD
jgi:hypothetical protein